MRSWSSFALFVALLSPLGTAKANNNGVLLGPDPGVATVDAGTTGLLNGVLSALTHADVDLDVDDHLILSTTQVELDDLLTEVMVEVGEEDFESLLNTSVSIEDVLDAMARVAAENGDLSAVASLETLALDLDGMALGNIELGDLFDISDIGLVDGVKVDLLDVIVNMASLWDQHHAIDPTTIEIDGDLLGLDASILEATVDINVYDPPQLHIGPDDIGAEVGGIEVLVHADIADIEANIDTTGTPLLGAKIVLGNIDLCLYAPHIAARADLLDDQNGAAMVDATVSRIHLCIGKPVQGALGEGSDYIDLMTEVTPSVIAEIVISVAGHDVPVAKVMARSVATVEADAHAVLFEGDFPSSLEYDLGASKAELFDELFAKLEITIEPLGIALAPIQLVALQNAALEVLLGEIGLPALLEGELLDGLALPTLDILGSGVTKIDLDLGGIIDLDGTDNNGGNHGNGDGDGDVDVDVDTDTDVDVSVDEDVDVSVDMDTDVGVDADNDNQSGDGDIDADVDTDVEVDVDDDGVDADVDVDADVAADEAMASADVNGALNLAGGGCSVGGAPNGASSGLAPLALLGLTLLLRTRRKTRS